ncbi:MAG: beta/gamma crystallin-related protein [Pseudomonadota bacterium]
MTRALKALALATTVCLATALPAAANYGQRGSSDEAVIFKHPDFRGDALAVSGPVYNLRELGFNDTVSSIDVRGAWEICVDPDFRGRCVVIDQPNERLSRIRMNDNITSLRPLNGTPRRISNRRDRHGDIGHRGRGNYQSHNQGIEGRNTVFFPRPKDAYGDRIPVGRGNANQFCREMGLGQVVYADRGRRNLTDVLCAK